MVALAGATAVALAGILAGTAAADPAVIPPPDNSITTAGSDTIQALGNQWSTDFNASTPTPANNFYSWDAFPGSATIVPKAGCASITRPNGSSAGIAAMNANATVVGPDGKTYNCLDTARSSRAFNSATDTGDVAVLFAHDAITWAANSGGNSVATLTPAQLTSIYKANAGSCVKWSDVGGTSTNAIVPVLPQISSGTRSTFLADLGLTTATVGSCVVNGNGQTVIEENEGTNCAFWTGTCPPNTTANPDVIYPFSVGSYICQADTGHCTNNVGAMQLKQINGVNPTVGSGATTTINGSFPAAFIRGLFIFTRYTGVLTAPIPDGTTSPGNINLRPFLGNGDSTGWICSTAGKADVSAQGFLPASTTCGQATHA
jgi:ABC-type phosphate transport system substrate-binding protein